MVCLIKPQFEAGRNEVGKKGVVKDPKVHARVIENVIGYARGENFSVIDLAGSPIKGPEGNIEYLIYLSKNPNEDKSEELIVTIDKLVGDTNEEFLRNSEQI